MNCIKYIEKIIPINCQKINKKKTREHAKIIKKNLKKKKKIKEASERKRERVESGICDEWQWWIKWKLNATNEKWNRINCSERTTSASSQPIKKHTNQLKTKEYTLQTIKFKFWFADNDMTHTNTQK